ncbi:MAG TPA: NAD(P)/FAD-dependent oxidoreductase [Vicinamibacterales bacterium]|nr:NAD(P)/FAD-dependent oxidoreductase [Vicinamibacterales bacterium]
MAITVQLARLTTLRHSTLSGEHSTAVIGAGPAGLTTAYVLAKRGVPVTVVESDAIVGGISRTVEHEGYRVDIGGHRFYTKSPAVEALWNELLPDDFLQRERFSRIYYGRQFYTYPLKPFEALWRLGATEATACVLSYLASQISPIATPRTFEDWVSNRFGRRLFEIFFQTYTEKVWGMPCSQISSDWAAQRIGSLSLGSALWHVLPLVDRFGPRAKTLTQTFRYPRRGPGQLWEACAAQVERHGGHLQMQSRVDRCEWRGGEWLVGFNRSDGTRGEVRASNLVSSAPITHLVQMLGSSLSERSREAADGLKYRDFLTVCLMFDRPMAFRDQWIYVHDPGVHVGRVQNFGAWSPEMLPSATTTCLGLEYFCHEGDGLWTMSDDALIAMGEKELRRIGLWPGVAATTGCVLRQPKAYPVYDATYAARVATIREEIDERFPTLHLVGRNGMHKYNNQDHAMMTGMLTAENIMAGCRAFDVWLVNGDAEYIEEESVPATGTALRAVPTAVATGTD